MKCQTVTLNSDGSKTLVSNHGDYSIKTKCETETTINNDGSRTQVTNCWNYRKYGNKTDK